MASGHMLGSEAQPVAEALVEGSEARTARGTDGIDALGPQLVEQPSDLFVLRHLLCEELTWPGP